MSHALPEIYVSKTDFERLSTLAFYSSVPTARDLEDELDRAIIVSDEDLPQDVVSIHSEIEFINLETRTATIVTLVFPDEADPTLGRISVFAPLGIALLGLRTNAVISWRMPDGFTRRLQVKQIKTRRELTA